MLKDPQTGKKEIVTPALEDLVLPGVTRDTIIVKIYHILVISKIQRIQSYLKRNKYH